MMQNWFECKVSYEKLMGDGNQKKVTESYIVDALSFTEAEARIIEEMTPLIRGEFVIKDIKRVKLSEIFFNANGDRFYKVKVCFIALDEKSGTEKRTAASMLVQASNLKEAIEALYKGMSGSLVDYEIASISETAIIDIFPYSETCKSKEETDFDNPSVRKFSKSLPEGEKTEINVSGKKFTVDKTGRDTIVTPVNDSYDN